MRIQLFEPHFTTAQPHVQRSRVPRSRQQTARRMGSFRMSVVLCVVCMLFVECCCYCVGALLSVCAQRCVGVRVVYVVVVVCMSCVRACVGDWVVACVVRVLCMFCVVFKMSRKNTPITNREKRKHTTPHRKHTPHKYHSNAIFEEQQTYHKKSVTYHSKTATYHNKHTTKTPRHNTKHNNKPVQYHTKRKRTTPIPHTTENTTYQSNAASKWYVVVFPNVMPCAFEPRHQVADLCPTLCRRQVPSQVPHNRERTCFRTALMIQPMVTSLHNTKDGHVHCNVMPLFVLRL